MGLFSRDFHTFNASAGSCWLPARRSTAEAIFVLKLYVYVYIRDVAQILLATGTLVHSTGTGTGSTGTTGGTTTTTSGTTRDNDNRLDPKSRGLLVPKNMNS